MNTITGLQRRMKEAEEDAKHQGYWYCISDALIIMVCGLLCNLQTIENLLKHARLEWGVEAMHWLLDVHFTEDKTRVLDMSA